MSSFTRFSYAVALLVLFTAGVCFGQNYPSKPIRMVTGSAGSSNDLIARLIAAGLSVSMGQPVVVENRGNQPSIPAGAVISAPPDGYTLIAFGPALWIVPLLEKMPYDAVKDLAPITIAAMSPEVLVINPSLPIKSVSDLIAYAKAKPGELNYGDTATGGPTHLSAELLKIMANVNIVRIPFKDYGALTTDLVANRVQLVFGNASAVGPLVKSGKLRALAVTSAAPSALFPDLPTVASAGLPGFELVASTPVFARAKTPDAIINKLNLEIVRIMNQQDVKDKLLSTGVEVVGSTPAELLTYVKSDIARMTTVIKQAGIHTD